jgi:hypothetical protein
MLGFIRQARTKVDSEQMLMCVASSPTFAKPNVSCCVFYSVGSLPNNDSTVDVLLLAALWQGCFWLLPCQCAANVDISCLALLTFTDALSPFTDAPSPFTDALSPFVGAIIPFAYCLTPFLYALIPFTDGLSPFVGAIIPF